MFRRILPFTGSSALALLIGLPAIIFAQQSAPAFNGIITGRVVYSEQNIPIEYANILLYSQNDLEYLIDKKVINVGKQMTAVSGTAVDVLENVPSVSVDIEGNVSLRGSGNFTVLIDNRPTILEPSDVLQQIPASTIETIEIITNPSAKYDPDGMSGIINIILKKKSLQGISGVANSNIGINDKYGGDFLINYRRSFYNTYLAVNYNNWSYVGERESENRTYRGDTTFYVLSRGESIFKRNPYGVRAGIDLSLGARDKISLGGQYNKRSMNRSNLADHEQWADPDGAPNICLSQNHNQHSHSFYSMTVDYVHQFLPRNHDFTGQLNIDQRQSTQTSSYAVLDTANGMISGQRSVEKGPGTRLRLKADYTLPLDDHGKIEAGFQSRSNRSHEENELYEYDTISGAYVLKPEFSHAASLNRAIHSLYSVYSNRSGKIGYQIGLRGEYEYRKIELIGKNRFYSMNRWDYFPTAHVSHQFPGGHQLMASYARRIERSRWWWLEPFLTWSDANNVHRGNPDLKPEYVDSYELGFQTLFGKSSFSAELYHRITRDKVEQTRSVYVDNIILHTVENIGTDYSTGIELMFDMKTLKWWQPNLMVNLYDYRIAGELYGESISRQDFNWSARINNELQILPATRLQISGRYNSPTITAQGERNGFFTADAAIKQEFLNRRLSVTLQARELLSSSAHENVAESSTFYSRSSFTRESPVFMLNISFNFNNYKPERRRDDNQIDVESIEEY